MLDLYSLEAVEALKLVRSKLNLDPEVAALLVQAGAISQLASQVERLADLEEQRGEDSANRGRK